MAFSVRITSVLRTCRPFGSLSENHSLIAVKARDVDSLGRSNAHSAAGTNIFPRAALPASRGSGHRSAVRARPGDVEAWLLVPVQKNVRQAVLYHKAYQFLCWFGLRPSVAFAVLNAQSVRLSSFLEPLVVVSVASAAILDAFGVVVVVNHLVKKRCCDVLDRSGKRSCSDVYLVRSAKLANPSVLPQREVPERTRR